VRATKREPFIWVRYDARRQLAVTMCLTPFAELAHRRLTDAVWATGDWPLADGRALQVLAHVPRQAWADVEAELRTVGWRDLKGRFRNR
jgi:hypothetical protein